MDSRKFGLTAATIVALLLALPVAAADDRTAPPAFNTLHDELPTTLTYDSDWKAGAAANARTIEPDSDMGIWSLALFGPAAMIFIVTALGLTITVRSLRDDLRSLASVRQPAA